MRRIINLYYCLIEILSLWWGSWILNASDTSYFSIQAAETNEVNLARYKFRPAMMFARYYLSGRYWTPVLIRVNPGDLPLKRPVRLGRRWGGGIRKKAF